MRAARIAIAMMVICGLTPRESGMADASMT